MGAAGPFTWTLAPPGGQGRRIRIVNGRGSRTDVGPENGEQLAGYDGRRLSEIGGGGYPLDSGSPNM